MQWRGQWAETEMVTGAFPVVLLALGGGLQSWPVDDNRSAWTLAAFANDDHDGNAQKLLLQRYKVAGLVVDQEEDLVL